MSYYYGHGLGRVKDKDLAVLNQLTEILRKKRYRDPQGNAAKLFKAGVTPAALRTMNAATLKRDYGVAGKYATESLPRYKVVIKTRKGKHFQPPDGGTVIRSTPQNVAKDYKRKAREYLYEARNIERYLKTGQSGKYDKDPARWKVPTGAHRATYLRKAKHLRSLARRALERAKRHSGVFSRSADRRR